MELKETLNKYADKYYYLKFAAISPDRDELVHSLNGSHFSSKLILKHYVYVGWGDIASSGHVLPAPAL